MIVNSIRLFGCIGDGIDVLKASRLARSKYRLVLKDMTALDPLSYRKDTLCRSRLGLLRDERDAALRGVPNLAIPSLARAAGHPECGLLDDRSLHVEAESELLPLRRDVRQLDVLGDSALLHGHKRARANAKAADGLFTVDTLRKPAILDVIARRGSDREQLTVQHDLTGCEQAGTPGDLRNTATRIRRKGDARYTGDRL